MSIAVSMFFMIVPFVSVMAQNDGKVVELTQASLKFLSMITPMLRHGNSMEPVML